MWRLEIRPEMTRWDVIWLLVQGLLLTVQWKNSPEIKAPNARNVDAHWFSTRFGKGTKGKTWRVNDVPGPGSYRVVPVVGAEGTKPSLMPKRPDTSAKYGLNSPGPCAYEVAKGCNTRSLSFTMGKGERGRVNLEATRIPSPLNYYPNDSIMRPASPFWRLA